MTKILSTFVVPEVVDYTHKKQTEGVGQYARVKLRFEPLPVGSGIVFEKISAPYIPAEYLLGVEKGVRYAAENQFPDMVVTDFKATMVDGAFHDVDSSILAFELAGRRVLDGFQPGHFKLISEPLEESTSKSIPFTDKDVPPAIREGVSMPRWRFWWAGGSPGFIFKSKRSDHNNLMVNYRPYPWTYKQKVWGITVCSVYNGLMIVIDLGWQRCVSIHYHPRIVGGNYHFDRTMPAWLKRKWGIVDE